MWDDLRKQRTINEKRIILIVNLFQVMTAQQENLQFPLVEMESTTSLCMC